VPGVRGVLDVGQAAPHDGAAGYPVWQNGIRLVWHKRRMRCQEALCGRGSFTEAIEQIPA